MATVVIQKRSNSKGISYAVHYRDSLTGRKRYYKTFTKKKDAEHARNDLRQLLETGDQPKQSGPYSPMTYNEIARLLQKEWDERFENGEISKATHENYSVNLKMSQQVLGKQLLPAVSEEEIRAYRNQLAGEVSNITSNRVLFIIKQVIKKGMALNAVKRNEAEGIRYLSEKKHVRNTFLLPNQLDALIASAEKGRAMYYLPALVCLGAEHGASKQECLFLRWKHVDFEYQDIGMIRFFRTKNGHERTEFLMPRSREYLKKWHGHLHKKRAKKGLKVEENELIFSRIEGGPIKGFIKAFRGACKRAGISNFHFHDLRHTFCSNLILSGADLKDAKEMIGHADLDMTDRYSHLTAQHKLLLQKQLIEHYKGNGRCNTP